MVKKMMVNRKANKMIVRVNEVVDFLEYAVDNKALISSEIVLIFVNEYENYLAFSKKYSHLIKPNTLCELDYNFDVAMELIDKLENNELVIY